MGGERERERREETEFTRESVCVRYSGRGGPRNNMEACVGTWTLRSAHEPREPVQYQARARRMVTKKMNRFGTCAVVTCFACMSSGMNTVGFMS